MQLDDDLPTADVDRLAERRREERRAVEEAGGGESEGFEQAERDLINNASHGDDHGTAVITRDARDEAEDAGETHGEADAELIPDS
ncbi:hypothetical protein DSM112329_01228 [Paraconexibacter sp. AEG42_29]|uniref:Uncharacterized protein n=1 Tax=Paraconexibacter sp. AEG42_29 TaxID=2997339 RepID=A0AAU7ART1_9ACTN